MNAVNDFFGTPLQVGDVVANFSYYSFKDPLSLMRVTGFGSSFGGAMVEGLDSTNLTIEHPAKHTVKLFSSDPSYDVSTALHGNFDNWEDPWTIRDAFDHEVTPGAAAFWIIGEEIRLAPVKTMYGVTSAATGEQLLVVEAENGNKVHRCRHLLLVPPHVLNKSAGEGSLPAAWTELFLAFPNGKTAVTVEEVLGSNP